MKFKVDQTDQKLRGGYYTPLDLASFMMSWIISAGCQNILEPSCGDGIFVDALASIKNDTVLSFTGIEILAEEADKTKTKRKLLPKKLQFKVENDDFLRWALERLDDPPQFDAVVGNPPFIRYQFLENSDQEYSRRIFDKFGLKFTLHTNAWVPFIIASIALLKPHGRLAMIVPSELLHVLHAESLRGFLMEQCERVLSFDPEEIWFEGTLQGAVILFAEKRGNASEHRHGLGIIPTKGKEFLTVDPQVQFETANYIDAENMNHKWTRALLTSKELELLDRAYIHPEIHRFDEIASVCVGIVTGANEFFLVDNQTVEKYGLEEFAHPMFGRSNHCPGVIYDETQHQANQNKGLPSNFLYFNGVSFEELPASVQEYIKFGEDQDLHKRYKCRIREPWFEVPSVYATRLGMLKRSHSVPKLLVNEIEAFTTDTAYRIACDSVDERTLSYCFINPLTVLTAELEGRHYGGGVLELVPSEIRRLAVPIPRGISIDLDRLDKMFKEQCPADEILRMQSRKVLEPLGFTQTEQSMFFDAWDRLRLRRQRQ
jgi:adenine-specific DNA methylase